MDDGRYLADGWVDGRAGIDGLRAVKAACNVVDRNATVD